MKNLAPFIHQKRCGADQNSQRGEAQHQGEKMDIGRLSHWYAKHYKDLALILVLAALLATLAWLISRIPFIRELETKTVDFRFRLAPEPERADSSIVLIAIDQGSLDYVRENMREGWPFPRDYYAAVTTHLNRCGAAAVMFDINFDSPDFDRAYLDSEAADNAFAAALAEAPQSVLSMTFEHHSSLPDSSLHAHQIPLQPGENVPQWEGVSAPIPLFTRNAGALGGINLLADNDANVRKAPLYYRFQDNCYPSLAFAAYLKQRGIGPAEQIATALPLDKTGQLYLNWHGKGGAEGVFNYHPFSVLLECSIAAERGFVPPLPDAYWQGKNIIIGATATGLLDLKSNPYTWGVPGMEVWATQLSNLLSGRQIRFLSEGLGFLLILLVCILVLGFVFRLKSGLSLLAILLLLLAVSLLSHLLFASERIVLPYSGLVLALVISWLCALTLSYIMEGRHKRELRQIFSRYLHPDLVNRIVENPDLVKMGGEELSVTVMFSDIYNFTGFSEDKTPRELVSYLNEYFRSFTNSILDHYGQLDKYTGDGLMAVFGAPIARQDHALLACRAALAHRNYSDDFKSKDQPSAPELFHLNTRLGINSGTVVAGNIGSERRMEYTSIGDAVNLASRLEGVNKIYQTRIIISQSTFEAVQDVMLCRKLDLIRVKGKFEATGIYELIGEKALLNLSRFSWIDIYHQGLELYQQGHFQQALQQFELLCAEPYCDTAAQALKQRCQALLDNPPAEWDGVFVLAEK